MAWFKCGCCSHSNCSKTYMLCDTFIKSLSNVSDNIWWTATEYSIFIIIEIEIQQTDILHFHRREIERKFIFLSIEDIWQEQSWFFLPDFNFFLELQYKSRISSYVKIFVSCHFSQNTCRDDSMLQAIADVFINKMNLQTVFSFLQNAVQLWKISLFVVSLASNRRRCSSQSKKT